LNINDYICVCISDLPINFSYYQIAWTAFILNKENNKFVFNLSDIKNFIKNNNNIDLYPGSDDNIVNWAYDINGHSAYDI